MQFGLKTSRFHRFFFSADHFLHCFYNMFRIKAIFLHQFHGFIAFPKTIIHRYIFHGYRILLYQQLGILSPNPPNRLYSSVLTTHLVFATDFNMAFLSSGLIVWILIIPRLYPSQPAFLQPVWLPVPGAGSKNANIRTFIHHP
jgi:hypothetical protein